MAAVKRPRHIVFGELPKTATGKVQNSSYDSGRRELQISWGTLGRVRSAPVQGLRAQARAQGLLL
jgi:hypothetical protein